MADACLAAAQVAQAVVAQQAPPPGASRVCVIPRLPLSELLYASGVVRALCGRGFDVMVVVHRDHANYVRRVFTGLPGVRFAFVRDWTDLHRGVLDRVQAQGYALLPLPSSKSSACSINPPPNNHARPKSHARPNNWAGADPRKILPNK